MIKLFSSSYLRETHNNTLFYIEEMALDRQKILLISASIMALSTLLLIISNSMASWYVIQYIFLEKELFRVKKENYMFVVLI